MDRSKIIAELMNNPDYRTNVEEILDIYLAEHPDAERKWADWFRGVPVEIPEPKPVVPDIVKVKLNTLEEIVGAVDAGKKVYCICEYYDVIRDKFGRYLIVCNLNKHTIGLTGAPGTKWERELNGRDFYYEEEAK